MGERKRIGIFGWGIVAPKSPNIGAFARNLERADTWLEPYTGYGPSNFLVGNPDFQFETYRPWFEERFPPAKFAQLKDKMGPMVQFAIGAFIQSLEQNPGIESYLQSLGTACHIYVGTGLGDLSVSHEQSMHFDRALRRWNEFWAAPERCAALSEHLEGSSDTNAPTDPSTLELGSEAWIDAKHAWESYWTARSGALHEYLAEARVIQSEPVPPSSGSAKLSSIRQKLNRIRKLNEKWRNPEEPWASVSANLLWNIANIPAAQISMIGKINGPAFAPVAACASFGVATKMAVDAINRGEAKAVIIGMTDPPPHQLTISAFYNANVLSADADVSRPMTGLKGTHVAGGSCIWILGDSVALMKEGFQPLGLEIVGVGTSSDAHHIITPSKGGPQLAMKQALDEVHATDITTWDMHATATPGDATEMENSLELLHPDVIFTARKGTFGHGMSVGGGWELTAQHIGMAQGKLFPMALTEGEMHADVKVHEPKFALGGGAVPRGYTGKLSMGVGGINSCVISRPWDPAWLAAHQQKKLKPEVAEPTTPLHTSWSCALPRFVCLQRVAWRSPAIESRRSKGKRRNPMRLRLWVATVLCLAVTFSLAAQQEHKMSAEENAMMEAMAKAVAPGPEHKMLDAMAGTFNTVVRYYPAPGAPAMESTGVSENKWVLGGRYLEQRFKGSSMGQPFEGIGYTGYDKIRKQYFGTWMDTMSTGVMMTTGQAEDGGKNWNFKGSMDDPMSGQSIPMTEKVTVVDKDKHIFEMWAPSREGTPFKTMEIVYTRKKK